MDLATLLDEIFRSDGFLLGVLSSPREKKSDHGSRITIHPVSLKGGVQYQITVQSGTQAFHKNIAKAECRKYLEEVIVGYFKQGLLCTATADYHILVDKKHNVKILRKPPSKQTLAVLPHNRQKQYILQENTPIDFLVALGIMNADGKVIPAKRDKFKQLNKFVEIVADTLPQLSKKHLIHIVDFGCGKSYLTFALYYMLKVIHGYDVQIHGLDLKEDVIQFCQALANKLNYTSLSFAVGNINDYEPNTTIDMVVSLHACDTATDAALEKAVHWGAKVILAVPCCQHELLTQVRNSALKPLLQHGILKERFSALVTDAARAQLLELVGYQTQVLEFIDLEHTPKNLLIRAIKKAGAPSSEALNDYRAFTEALHIKPFLEKQFLIDCK